MANEIVKYSNQFNNQALRKFTALDLDLLMAIASKVRDQGTNEVQLTFEELRRLAGLRSKMSNDQLAERIAGVNDRLLALRFRFVNERRDIIQFALFSAFITSPDDATLTVAVNQRFAFLLNDLTAQFTRFELNEFTDLKSSYAKEFYRRAKQYRSTGVWKVSLEEFRRLLDVPESYKPWHVNSKVVKPIEDELGPLIHLRVERRYAKHGNGKGRSSLAGFTFRFDREPDTAKKTGKPAVDAVPSPVTERMSAEERELLAKEREAHGGRMFAGAKGYVETPLFGD